MTDSPYEMSISLSVLDHLGLNLYSNTPAVLSEVIANAWDADATEVDVDIDTSAVEITVTDNGHGMDLNDINKRYLRVGYRRRREMGRETPRGRRPMGRKGIGKLSLFSIANKIYLCTLKEGGPRESFLMDADELRATVEQEGHKAPGTTSDGPEALTPRYRPRPVDLGIDIGEHGTAVKITDLKKVRLTQGSINALRKRIARRFSLLDDDFLIRVNGKKVEFSDRDYFRKARFLFQYGDYDYSQHCRNLDSDNGEPLAFARPSEFGKDGHAAHGAPYAVTGWIAIARHSNDLDDRSDDQDDNLNRITVLMRGKVAQEDILQEYRLGGMITKYIYGEIHADFLDDDDNDDIATTSRQRIFEDDPRYLCLKEFIRHELNHIWNETNKLKEKKSVDRALENPHIKKWYDAIPGNLRSAVTRVFKAIDLANVEEEYRGELYANGVLAFERLKTSHAIEHIEYVDSSNLPAFLEWLADMGAIEAANVFETVRGRIAIIEELENKVDENNYEKLIQNYISKNLWLLDPAWERTTEYTAIEERMQNALNRVPIRGRKEVKIDIRYRRVAGAHVIIELKRPGVKLRKTQIEDQINDYIEAVRNVIEQDPSSRHYPLEAICLVGKLPVGWENPRERRRDEESLKAYGIRIMTYEELISNARSAYAKFLGDREEIGALQDTINAIRSYRHPAST